MVQMIITEYWNSVGIPRGEHKATLTYKNSGYASVAAAVKELSARFPEKLAHKGASEVVFAEPTYVQVISFRAQS